MVVVSAEPWIRKPLDTKTGFLPGIFSGGAKYILMQISFVMLIFLLFSDEISGEAKVCEGGKLPQGAPRPPCGRKPEKSPKMYQTSKCKTAEHLIDQRINLLKKKSRNLCSPQTSVKRVKFLLEDCLNRHLNHYFLTSPAFKNASLVE